MYSVCTTYYANRSTTAVDRFLSTISIAEFLMCLPFHTIQLTHKIPTRLYMGTLAGRAFFWWSLSVSVYVGYYRGYLHWRDKYMMLGGQWLEKVSSQSGFYVASLSLLNCGVDSFGRRRLRQICASLPKLPFGY